MRITRYPKHAPPIWAYEQGLYARVVAVRTALGTLLIGTPAALAALGFATEAA